MRRLHRRTTRERAAAISAAALVACLAAGCAGGDATAANATAAASPTAPVLQPGRPGQPNASLTGTAAAPRPSAALDPDDARFMSEMIVHHAQAVVMVGLALDHLTDTEVRAIAARIGDEQEPEIKAMARWLRERRQDVPPQADNPRFGSGSHSGHGDHAGMPGMATPEQLRQLADARGVEADRLFLRLMTAHHRGALTMVLDQQRTGSDERVTALGDEIHVTQQTQIGHMQRMLDRLV